MSSNSYSGKTVSVAQGDNDADVEIGTERCATRFRERGNGTTNEHVTVEDTFTAPTSVTQRDGESDLGQDNIALDMREDDEGGVTAPVAAQVESDDILAQVGATEGGQAMVTSKQRELDIETEQGENVVYMGDFDFAETGDDPYDWTCAIEDESRTLEQEERAAGVEAEFDRHHERAHAAHKRGEEPGLANAVASRRLARSWLPEPRGTTVEEVQAEVEDEKARPHPRVREGTKEVAGEINEEAERIRERYAEACPKKRLIAKAIAERVANGQQLNEAVLGVDEYVRNRRPLSGQRQYIKDVSQWQWDATIEGEVVTLWEPKDPWSQQQVGLVDDGTGECKVTVWNNSYEDTVLHEGDRVRIIDSEPDRYNGRPTLAVSSRTEIQVLEEGDGPAPQGARWYNPPNFDEPSMEEIARRRTYRHRNPKRRFSANPNKRFEK
jgi:hypothetical protein